MHPPGSLGQRLRCLTIQCLYWQVVTPERRERVVYSGVGAPVVLQIMKGCVWVTTPASDLLKFDVDPGKIFPHDRLRL